MQLIALFRLGFPTAPGLLSLNLATYGNSQAHSTKGTPSPNKLALTACKSTVSGSLSLPFQGTFHLSLTVLCAIGSRRVFSLGGWSPQIPTGFLVSRRTQVMHSNRQKIFDYEAFTLFDCSSQRHSSNPLLSYCSDKSQCTPTTPDTSEAPGLGSSPFARRY